LGDPGIVQVKLIKTSGTGDDHKRPLLPIFSYYEETDEKNQE